jgi:hypothetical protein
LNTYWVEEPPPAAVMSYGQKCFWCHFETL